jgi:hypothetical protein
LGEAKRTGEKERGAEMEEREKVNTSTGRKRRGRKRSERAEKYGAGAKERNTKGRDQYGTLTGRYNVCGGTKNRESGRTKNDKEQREDNGMG